MEMDPKKSNILPFAFFIANATSNQTAVALAAAGEASAAVVPQQPCPWAGSIVGISVQVEATRSGGILTVRPTINGTAAAANLVIDADPVQYASAKYARGQYPVTAGQRIGAIFTTDSAWAASTTPSVRVVVFVHVYEN